MSAPPFLPRAALRLGFLGLAPLAICALVSLSHYAATARLGNIGFSLYAATLLAFLGGVRCGFELMRAPNAPKASRLLFSALPGLGGWALALFVLVGSAGAGGFLGVRRFVRRAICVGPSQRRRRRRARLVPVAAPRAHWRLNACVSADPAGERSAMDQISMNTSIEIGVASSAVRRGMAWARCSVSACLSNARQVAKRACTAKCARDPIIRVTT